MTHVRFVSVRPVIALVATVLVASCTGDNAGIRRLPLEPTASPGELKVSPEASTLAWVGAQGQLQARLSTPDGGSVSNLAFTWTSLNPGVVTVDGSGRLTSMQEGDAKVVVRVLNLADTADVAVRRLPATVTLTADTALITEFGTPLQLGATVADGGGASLDASVVWTSSDTAVARVSQAGLVTPAGGQGVTTVTARAGTVSRSARVRVKVGPSSITVNPATVALTALGDTLRLTGIVRNARGDVLPGVPVTFSWADTTIAHVTPGGLVTARGVGTTTLGAAGDTVRLNVSVSVTQTPDSVALSPSGPLTFLAAATQAFSASVFDRNGNAIPTVNKTWTSSDTTVARISNEGVLTAKAAGTTTIRATAGPASASAVVTVTEAVIDAVDVETPSVVLDPGDSVQIQARFLSEGTEVVGGVATWTSDSTAIATVTSSGLVRGVAQGMTWVRVTAGMGSDSVQVTVNAAPSEFDIVVRYVGDVMPTEQQQAAFAAAAFRWENIIIGNQSPGTPNIEAAACGVPHPAFNELVDDLIIFVQVGPIDGVNGVLASAGPCVTRVSNGLAIVGQMKFDTADMDNLAASGHLVGTVVHEMGHVLGFGTGSPWTTTLVGAGGADPYWPGAQAVSRFGAAGGVAANVVPVENAGGAGTQDAHWRESTMGRELMTGFLNSGVPNPLSAITIGAMQDMGYTVDYSMADSYTVSPTSRVGPDTLIRLVEEIVGPRFELDSRGVMRAVRR